MRLALGHCEPLGCLGNSTISVKFNIWIAQQDEEEARLHQSSLMHLVNLAQIDRAKR
jgi:hypothetical protein